MRGFRFPTLAIGLLLALLNSSAQQPTQAPLTLPQQQPATSTAATLPPAPEQIRSTVGFLMVAYQNGPAQGGVIGTCFFVWVPDTRLGENKGFVYLVTNRHVAQPGIDLGQPYQVRAVYLRMNLATPEQGIQSVAGEITLNDQVHWFFPSDDAADLAILPLAPDQKRFAYLSRRASSQVLSYSKSTKLESGIPSFSPATSEVFQDRPAWNQLSDKVSSQCYPKRS